MIKIGEFAKLGGVSIKTLRHYDCLALLKPARVDHYSGYRYYELSQLQRLNEIMLFKLMGFSLESVSHLLVQSSPEELAEMLGEQEARLCDQQQEVHERLAWLRSNRLQLESGGPTLNTQVVLKPQPALALITLKEMIIMEDRLHRQQTIARLLRQLDDMLPDGRQWREEPFWVMLECEQSEADSDLQRIEVGIPGKLPAPTAPLIDRLIPPRDNVLSLLYDPAGMQAEEARLAMFEWIQRCAYHFDGPFIELHYQDREQSMIELQRSVFASLPPQIKPIQRSKKTMSTATIVTKPAQLYIGKTRSFTMSTTDLIARFWEEFFTDWQSIQDMLIAPGTAGFHSLGLCYPMGEGESFDYMVAFPLKDNKLSSVPAGFEVTMLPEQQYVAVPAPGPKESIHKAYTYIFETWLPQQTEWEHDREKPDFELYPPEFNDFKEDSLLYIYVPIRKKE